jgi:hypothetical protein
MFLFMDLPSGCRRTAPELRDRLRREGYAQRARRAATQSPHQQRRLEKSDGRRFKQHARIININYHGHAARREDRR